MEMGKRPGASERVDPWGQRSSGPVGSLAVVEPPRAGAARSSLELWSTWATIIIRAEVLLQVTTWTSRGQHLPPSASRHGGAAHGPPPAAGHLWARRLFCRAWDGGCSRAQQPRGGGTAAARVRRAVKHMTPNLPHGAARSGAGARVLSRLGMTRTTPSARGFFQPLRPQVRRTSTK